MSKKDFTNLNNPATAFISGANEEISREKITTVDYSSIVTPEEKEDIKKPKREVKQKKETKSKRWNLIVKPSIYENIEKIAYMNKISPNEQVSRCLEKHIEDNKAIIEKYNEFFE